MTTEALERLCTNGSYAAPSAAMSVENGKSQNELDLDLVGTVRKFYLVLKCLFVVLQVLAVLGAAAKPAYAYVDPGSGLLAVQIISTTFAGTLFMLRKRINGYLRHLFGGSDSRKQETTKK